MKKSEPTCVDCQCKAVSHHVKHLGNKDVTEEIEFECGSRQRESYSASVSIGTVEFVGCGCGNTAA